MMIDICINTVLNSHNIFKGNRNHISYEKEILKNVTDVYDVYMLYMMKKYYNMSTKTKLGNLQTQNNSIKIFILLTAR